MVWARDLGAEKNKILLNYYPNRKKWSLQVGKLNNVALKPIPEVVSEKNFLTSDN